MKSNSLQEDALEWCSEDRSIFYRTPLIAYGLFLLWKIFAHNEIFTPLDFLNLGIHELGHVAFRPLGEWMGIAGGSIAQVVAPIYGIWQFIRQRDYFASAFSLAWLGESLDNLSIYIGDARKQELPLVNVFGGDPLHDWNYLLASGNLLHMDNTYALRVRILAFVMVASFLWLGLWLLQKMWKSQRS